VKFSCLLSPKNFYQTSFSLSNKEKVEWASYFPGLKKCAQAGWFKNTPGPFLKGPDFIILPEIWA
jgi:hypothetical protein